MTALQKLLRYPHAAAFDRDAHAVTAFRLRHADGLTWSVADEVLSVTRGTADSTYDLAQFTLGSLAVRLEADGFTVIARNATVAKLSALVLVEGKGDQNESNGDLLTAYTSMLWVLLSGYAARVRQANGDVALALQQMNMREAGGEWLDLWGALYNTARLPGEADGAYQPRIEREAFRLRVNARAIEAAITDATGYRVRIDEPWQDLFTLDESELSGSHKTYDGATVGPHLIQPIGLSIGIDWTVVLPVIERNKAAGVLVMPPYTRFLTESQGLGHFAFTIRSRVHGFAGHYEDRALLDFADIEESHVPVDPAIRWQGVMHTSGSTVPVYTWAEIEGPWPSIPWSSLNYIAHSAAITRNLRPHYSAVLYGGQVWSSTTGWAPVPWAELDNPRTESLHLRLV